MSNHVNKLINESSPYLLQHAHNPVNWYPWGDEALLKAKQENKPILISIGYAACHWCHVMEKESFEDEEVAAIMNEHFVNIKIDREERPDIDHIYMDAVQAMTGSGGWPLNVFLTSDTKPFYGGTYFPPVRAFNRPSWKEVLYGVAKAYKENKQELTVQAENLIQHLQNANSFGQTKANAEIPEAELFTPQHINLAYQNLMKTADLVEGGFGRAPKFLQTFSISWLLKYFHVSKDEKALKQACLSLDKMIYGGIYDQIGGGIARYSTDNEWLLPHFEKMLYDNALLISTLADAYLITKNKEYERIIHKTIEFVEREMLSSENLFLSALDADSDGEEGKFYVWTKEEINEVLKEDSELFCSFFDITEKGNWDGKNILQIKMSYEHFAEKNSIDAEILKDKLNSCATILLSQRNKRERPLTDDKILLGWNALMNTALSKAFAATGREAYKKMAIANMEALLEKFNAENNRLFHTYKRGVAKYPAFLDDYAFLIQALIYLQEITSNTEWLMKAKELTEFVKENFEEKETGFFYFTESSQKDVIVRKKEVYDGATPSGNSVMVLNLIYLSIIFNIPTWQEQATKSLSSLLQTVIRYPGSFGVWVSALIDQCVGINEIAIVGPQFDVFRDKLISHYLPNKILQTSLNVNTAFPLQNRKPGSNKTLLFLCKNYTCLQPVTTVNSLLELIVKTQLPIHNK
ncbi:MAG TPA: thioredoxin domain-containing protein [Chitinophagaceae bacterium]|nr:thioredoxin domain-containing protein [Chitinophagaceae bacterium]